MDNKGESIGINSQSKLVLWLFVIVTLLVIVSPFIFTRPAISEIFDFTGKGEIGDVIGGVTGPIINIFAAYLVFLAFNQQVKANEIQRKALRFEVKKRDEDIKFNTILIEVNWCSEEYRKINVRYFGKDISLNEFILDYFGLAKETLAIKLELAFENLLSLRNFLDHLIAVTKQIESVELRLVLIEKIWMVYNMQTQFWKKEIDDHSEVFNKLLIYTTQEEIESLDLNNEVILWLKKNRRKHIPTIPIPEDDFYNNQMS